jgi:hypothetical protein
MYQRTLKYIKFIESFRKCRAHLTLVNFSQLSSFFYTPCILNIHDSQLIPVTCFKTVFNCAWLGKTGLRKKLSASRCQTSLRKNPVGQINYYFI